MGSRVQRGPAHYRRRVEVGPTKAHAFSSIQAALDSISDAALDNPYLVCVEPGDYVQGPIFHDKSHVHLIGAGPGATRIIKAAIGAGGDTPGAYNIGYSSSSGSSPYVTRNVVVSNVAILNRLPGGAGTGEPPEPALAVGKSGDATQAWDEIHIENCHIVGNHDGLQIFGYSATRGKMWVRSNYIAALHDAFTLKTTGEIFSSGNQIHADDSGLAALAGSGYTLDNWKTTGFHFGTPSPTTIPVDVLLDRLLSVGDSIVIRATGKSVGGGSPAQNYAAGVLWYPVTNALPAKFVGLSIDLRYLDTVNAPPTVGGVVYHQTGPSSSADGTMVFQGGSIHVDQAGVGGTSPTVVSCVAMTAAKNSGSWLRLIGTVLSGRNAAGTCYGLRTANANARIMAACYSTLANVNDVVGGTITAVAPTASLW